MADYKPNSYELLLIDIRMDKLNGFQLVEKVKRIDKQVKVCFMTAFEAYYNAIREEFRNLDENCFIRKPIKCDDLVERVFRQIDSSNSND